MTDTPDAKQFWANAPIAPPLTPTHDPKFWKTPEVIGGGVNLTQDQQREMAVELVKHGGLSAEKANEILKAQGTEPTPADNRSDEAKAHDATWAPPASPADYKLDYTSGIIPRGTQPADVLEFNTVSTAWLSEIQMPASIGASVLEQAMTAGQNADRMTPTERQLWAQSQRVIFDRQARTPERAAELRSFAAQVIASATKTAGFSAALQKGSALQDAAVLMNLGLHGERVAARSKMK